MAVFISHFIRNLKKLVYQYNLNKSELKVLESRYVRLGGFIENNYGDGYYCRCFYSDAEAHCYISDNDWFEYDSKSLGRIDQLVAEGRK